MDIFEERAITPRDITNTRIPFHSTEHLYELKLNGLRCIAYLDSTKTDLRDQWNQPILKFFPELQTLHLNVTEKCILDGELIIYRNGTVNKDTLDTRLHLYNSILKHQSTPVEQSYHVSYIASDILYYKNTDITSLALFERKILLENIVNESLAMSLSYYTSNNYNELYTLAVTNHLTGIIAKKKDNGYYSYPDPSDWIAMNMDIKNSYLLCGYQRKENGYLRLILGKYQTNLLLTYCGTIEYKPTTEFFNHTSHMVINSPCLSFLPSEYLTNVTWLSPIIYCNINYAPIIQKHKANHQAPSSYICPNVELIYQ